MRHVLLGIGFAAAASACTLPSASQKCSASASAAVNPVSTRTYAGDGTVDIKDTSYPIPPGAFFVSPDGDDAGDGSQCAPWQTVGHAVATVAGGSTIVLRGGTYRESVTLEKKLTLQAYPHEKAWLKGSEVVTGWVSDGCAWRKDGWTQHHHCSSEGYYTYKCDECDTWGCPIQDWNVNGENTRPPEECPDSAPRSAIDCRYPLAKWPDIVLLDGKPLVQVASLPVGKGEFYVDVTKNQLYIGSDPSGRTVEAAALRFAIRVEQKASGTVIRGLGVAHYADSYGNVCGVQGDWVPPDENLGGAVRILRSQATIEDSTLAFNAHYGVYIESSPNCVVVGSTLVFNGSQGVSGTQSDGMRLEGNAFAYNNQKRFYAGWYSAGVDVCDSKDVSWRDNVAEHNLAPGFWCDTDCTGTIVSNTVRENLVGIAYEAGSDAIIASNLVVRNEVEGIWSAGGSHNVKIYNNTLVGNGTNLFVDEGDEILASNVTLKNNLLSDGTGFFLSVSSSRRSAEEMGVTVDYNLYHRTSSSSPLDLIRWARLPNEFVAATLYDFRDGTSPQQEVHGIGLDDASPKILFRDAAGGDFRLAPASPAMGRGEPLPPDVAAALGVDPGQKVDIGVLNP